MVMVMEMEMEEKAAEVEGKRSTATTVGGSAEE